MARANLRLLVFPAADLALRRDVDMAVKRLSEDLPNDLARQELERDLRRWYRSLQIHDRDDLGGYPDDPSHVWYVYRDGRVRRGNPLRERLYAALATARSTRETTEHSIESARRTAVAAGFREAADASDMTSPDSEASSPIRP
jgi:hypothetical protein